MIRALIFIWISMVGAGAFGAEAKRSPVDRQVLSRLAEMSRYLRSLDSFRIDSNVTFDLVLKNEQKVEFNAIFIYKVRRPDKLFVDIKSDNKRRQYFYSGKGLTVYAPDEKLYAVLGVEGPLPEVVRRGAQAGIEMPLADLFLWGTDKASSKEITSAIFVEEVERDGKTLEHFAIRQGNVDWQVWITKGEEPLPEKLVYTTNDDPAQPSFSSQMDWDINPDFAESLFRFDPPQGSHLIYMYPNGQKTRE